MPSHQADNDASMKPLTASFGWNYLQTLKSLLSGRLAEPVVNRRPGGRPGKLENDAAFFEDDLRYILKANSTITQLSEERYKDMDKMALSLLDVLNSNVNRALVECQSEEDHCDIEMPEHISNQSHDATNLDSRYKHLNALRALLLGHSLDRFNLASGPKPVLFRLSSGGYGEVARGHTKVWRAFLDRLSAEARIDQGLQTISLQAMGLSTEEPGNDHSELLEKRASVVVNFIFKEFRRLDCAGVKTHEIRLRLSGLYSGPPLTTLDLFVSSCPNENHTWHEAECSPFSNMPVETGKPSLCSVIRQAIDECAKLHLHVDQQGLLGVPEVMPRISSSYANFTEETLMALFQQKLFSPITIKDSLHGLVEKKVNSLEKAEIALTLARCLLDFFDDEIELASHSWVPEQILFIAHSTSTPPRRGDTYVSLKPRLCRLKSVDLLEEYKAGNPILLSFARLLLEIETGEKIDDIQIHPEAQKNWGAWVVLCQLVDEKKYKGESVQYLEAVEGCLHLCDKLPEPQHRVTGSAASKILRIAIYEKVIRKLELLVGAQSAERKKQILVYDRRQTEKPPIARQSKRVSAISVSKRENSLSATCERRIPWHSKLSGASRPGNSSGRTSSSYRRGEQSRTSKQSFRQRHGKFDGRLCDRLVINAFVTQPRTFEILHEVHESRLEFRERDDIVKIAVLDTGIDLRHEDFRNMRAVTFHEGRPIAAQGETSQLERMPIQHRRNFCNNNRNDVQDRDGHGTQVASIILRLAPRARLCIARICVGDVDRGLSEGKKGAVTNDIQIRHPQPDIVAQAIHWAIEMKVNIINMSFGFDESDPELDEALRLAQSKDILIFAAMANEGIYKAAAWPARDSDNTIGIHSCAEMGKTSSPFTPKPSHERLDFMVLGENIFAHWLTGKGGGFRPVEGTSFATPVAVSMAALILAFTNQKVCRKLREETEKKVRVKDLGSNRGMRRLLRAISEVSTDRYLWINPMLLWATFPEEGAEDTPGAMREHAWRVIHRALKK